MLWVDEKFNNVGEFETRNSDYVLSYPALAVNSQAGEVATSMMYGGNDKVLREQRRRLPARLPSLHHDQQQRDIHPESRQRDRLR